MGVTKSYNGKPLQEDDFAVPCGLIAKYRFTDTFKIIDPDAKAVDIDEEGIAYGVDKRMRFKNVPDSENVAWVDVEDEHFMVWY